MANKKTDDGPLTREDVQKMIDASLLAHDIVHGHHEALPTEDAASTQPTSDSDKY